MEWINIFGLIFIVVIMIPNIIFAMKCKDGFANKWKNKFVEPKEKLTSGSVVNVITHRGQESKYYL